MNTGADGRQTQLVFVAGVVGPALGARPAVPCQGATGARVGCPPSSDGVQVVAAVRCGRWLADLCGFNSRSHSRRDWGVAGGRRTLQAANLKSTRLGAKITGNRRFLIAGLFRQWNAFFYQHQDSKLGASKHALELCSLFANVSVLLSRVRGARDLVVPRYALRHIVDFPHRARPFHVLVPGRAGSAGLTGYKGSGTLLARISPLKVYGDDITYHCHRDVSMA